MPLVFAKIGDELEVKRVGGTPEFKKHLEDMGFVPGAVVKIISTINGSLIVNIKDSRIAVSREMAEKIMV